MRVWEFYLRIRILVQHVISLVCAEGSEALLTELTASQDVPDIPVFPLPPAPGIMVPFPLFRHLLQAMQTASNKERATERAATSRTLEFTSVSTMKSKP